LTNWRAGTLTITHTGTGDHTAMDDLIARLKEIEGKIQNLMERL
jgi:hypothetical protein